MAAEDGRARRRAALDRDSVQRVGATVAPIRCRGLNDPLLWPTELLEHDEPARTEPALAQEARERGGAVGAGHVRDDSPPRLEQRRHELDRPTHGAHELDLGRRPAKPGARECKRRRMRMDRDSLRP